MTTSNTPHTNDAQQTRPASDAYRDNYDLIKWASASGAQPSPVVPEAPKPPKTGKYTYSLSPEALAVLKAKRSETMKRTWAKWKAAKVQYESV